MPSGKERRWKLCSRNSRIRSNCVACACGDYGLFVSSSSWRRLPRTSSDCSASSAKGKNQRWRRLCNLDHENSLYRSALGIEGTSSQRPFFNTRGILRQLRCRLRVNGRRYSRGSSSSSGAFRGRIPYPLTMRFSTSNWRGVWSVAAPASLTPSNRLKFEFLSLRQFSGDPQLTSVY